MNTKTRTFMFGVAVGLALHYGYNRAKGAM